MIAAPLAPPEALHPASERLPLGHGMQAELIGPPEARTLEVRSGGGELVFRFDPASGRVRVVATAGAVEVVSRGGDLSLQSAATLHLRARRLELEGSEAIALRSGAGSRLQLDPAHLRLGARQIEMVADKACLEVRETTLRGELVHGAVREARWVLERLEVAADTVFQRSRQVFQKVEELAQITAGRMRTLVRGSHLTRAQKTTWHAREDVKINGKKIHLG